MMMVVAVVMQSNTVELLERISNLGPWRSEARVKRNALDSRRANVYALALFHVAEVGRLHPSALMWNDRRLHVAQECPLRGAEEGRGLHIGGSSARS